MEKTINPIGEKQNNILTEEENRIAILRLEIQFELLKRKIRNLENILIFVLAFLICMVLTNLK